MQGSVKIEPKIAIESQSGDNISFDESEMEEVLVSLGSGGPHSVATSCKQADTALRIRVMRDATRY